MRHRLFNLAAAVSLVLCVATVALWVRSYFRWDEVRRSDHDSADIIGASRGVIYVIAFALRTVPRLRSWRAVQGWRGGTGTGCAGQAAGAGR